LKTAVWTTDDFTDSNTFALVPGGDLGIWNTGIGGIDYYALDKSALSHYGRRSQQEKQ
jgi:hypothetical protein